MIVVVLEGAAGVAALQAGTWTDRVGDQFGRRKEGIGGKDGRRERALSAEHNDRWTRKVGRGDGGKRSREGKQQGTAGL